LKIKKVSGGYPANLIIKNMSFELNSGDLLFVIGPNGSGKTTLFKLMLGLLKKKSGDIQIDDIDGSKIKVEDFSKKIAYIPQQHEPVFDYTVKEMVLMGRTCHLGMFSVPSKEDVKKADEAIEFLNISAFKDREYGKLSGGEMQMVLIARAICQQAKIIIMDEPMMNLDYKNQRAVLSAIELLLIQGYIIIMSTHNMIHTGFKKAKVLLIKEGANAGFGKAENILTKNNLEKVYDVPMDVVKTKDSQGKTRFICIPL